MDIMEKDNPAIQAIFASMDSICCKLDELFKDYQPVLNNERYISEKQLAKMLNVCERTLLDYRTQGILSYVKSEKKIMYRESDVQKMLERMYVKAWKD